VSFFTHANSYIGSVYTFSSSLEESGATVSCQNCLQQRRDGVLSTAQIPITNVILGYAKDPTRKGIYSLKPGEVESYLEKNLSWRAVIAIEVRYIIVVHRPHPLVTARLPPLLSPD
jgi:tyrosinase